jgi:hypothetical protein
MIIQAKAITEDGFRRPDLPGDVAFSVVEDYGDTMTVQVSGTPEQLDAVKWHVSTRTEKIARVRWEHETGGTMWQGHKVRTDRESQSLVLGAMVLGQPVRWKFADSWADMTPQDMQSLVATVASHVEACFRREEELQQDPTQDINSGWPAGWV